jgi:nucleoside phosphorylase/tetratricopeptide (TPR) repeat protein
MLDEEYTQVSVPATDTNVYTLGRIGPHKVVIAGLPAGVMGTNQAATVASQMKSSFSALRFLLLVGIGGGVPSDENDIRLGDVVISQPSLQFGGVIQYDMGKTEADGRITRTGSLNAPPTILLNALAKLRANYIREKTCFHDYLDKVSKLRAFAFPGHDRDVLYEASSRHVAGPTCAKCDQDGIIHRDTRLTEGPHLFFGSIASGNQVMRDGLTRDRVSQDLNGVLCFEMEAAGMMNNFPCLVIRGVCDYSDSHKNKTWQHYAAATAAACAKELLCNIPSTSTAPPTRLDYCKSSITPRYRNKLTREANRESHFIVPLGQNAEFFGRGTILREVLEVVLPEANENDCQRTVIQGLGGVGKTQVALQTAYSVRKASPECSVFWVPAVDSTMFENAYREIGNVLNIPNISDDKADVKQMVKDALSRTSQRWVLIIDNADDSDLLFGGSGGPALIDFLPFNRNGSILFTTRNHEVSVRLDVPRRNTFIMAGMSPAEGLGMLQSCLQEDQIQDVESTNALVHHLAYLPLAIKQASAYMKRTGISTSEYLGYCLESDSNQIMLLGQDFADRGRYNQILNPIATTWLISFTHMARSYPLAAHYLKFTSFLAEKDLPLSLLPQGKDRMEEDEAVAALKGYGFITSRERSQSFDIHRLVRLATRNSLQNDRAWYIENVTQQITESIPFPTDSNRHVWARHLPHIQVIIDFSEECADKQMASQLMYRAAIAFRMLGKYREAEVTLRRALELDDPFASKSPLSLTIMNNLGRVLGDQQNFEEAEKILRETLRLKREVLGPEDRRTLICVTDLGILLGSRGNFQEAKNMLQYALEKTEITLGPRHIYFLSTMDGLAFVYGLEGNHQQAEQLHRHNWESSRLLRGPRHPQTLLNLVNLAVSMEKQGRYAEAERTLLEVLQLQHETLGADHPNTVETRRTLDNLPKRQGTVEEPRGVHQIEQ